MRTESDEQFACAWMMMIILQSTMMYQWYYIRRRSRTIDRRPRRNMHAERIAILERLYCESDALCLANLRMARVPFQRLCAILKTYGLEDSRSVKVQEQVALFLNTVGHDCRTRSNVLVFFRSGETISFYFHKVLLAVLRMYKDNVKPSTADNSPDDSSESREWSYYFDDAIGAIDGTHFNVNVLKTYQPRYRNRKGLITQNVLVAVTFDMKFRYVLAGWEGSAHDGRVLRCAISKEGRRFSIPIGKYYLADAGYGNVQGFLTPYRSVRYHLSEQEGYTAETPKELYNFRHSSLRNVVERSIGVLKKRFAFLRNPTFHDIDTQVKIVLACCSLHNYLRDVDPDDTLGVPHGHREDIDEEDEFGHPQINDYPYLTIEKTPEWTFMRDALAAQMWTDLHP